MRKRTRNAETRAVSANDYYKFSATRLVVFSNNMVAAFGSSTTPPFGLTVLQKTTLQTNAADLAAANAAVEAAKTAYDAAVRDREAKKRATITSVNSISRTLFGSSATAAQISAFGLSPHAKEKSKIVPMTPATITAQILPDGGVRLNWSRSGNAREITFQVETRRGDGDWTFLCNATACRMVVSDCTPGMPTRFRVRASRGAVVSTPSPEANVYPVAAAPALRLAA